MNSTESHLVYLPHMLFKRPTRLSLTAK